MDRLDVRERILIVDDTASVRATVVDILQRQGYDAVAADDGLAALRLLEAGCFDLVISDIVMPRLGGLQMVELVRRVDPEVPVLLLTGYATEEVALEALATGAVGFLEKPFRVESLVAAVRSALTRCHLRQYAREVVATE